MPKHGSSCRGCAYLSVQFDEAHVQVRKEDDLPEGWDARPYGPASQKVGDTWIRTQAPLVLRVPTVALAREQNYLINPRHLDASDLEVGEWMFQFPRGQASSETTGTDTTIDTGRPRPPAAQSQWTSGFLIRLRNEGILLANLFWRPFGPPRVK